MTNKIRLLVDPNKYEFPSGWIRLLGRLNSDGIHLQAEVPEQSDYCYFYVDFDTEEEAAVFKLTYL